MKTPHPILGLLAFAFIVAVAGEAWAACTGSNRIDYSDAECLHGWWDNNSWPKDSTFGARNLCPDWGTVVAKVDIAGTSDRTWHLANGDKRRGRTAFTVRDIYCCKDLADNFCDKTDLVSVASCRDQFEDSEAADDCVLDSDPSVINTHCVFDLTCEYTADGTDQEHSSTYTIIWHRADQIQFCVQHTGNVGIYINTC